MTDWTSGYVAELDYPHEFTRELAPSHLGFCATAAGLKHPAAGGPLQICELGCGQGFSANLIAAANPQAEIHAMDFNPAQMANARDLAAEAGLDNIRFHERSFEDFAAAPGLPEAFDIITLHGVLSWVSEENRRHITDFIAARLAAGGMVYVSYNALPGWAAAVPLRRIMADRAATAQGPLEDRIGAALAFADQLQQAGAGYFAANPALENRLSKLAGQNRSYLAHEYFNRDWTPFHFADVAQELSAAKLAFAAAADPLDHVADFKLSPEQSALLDGESDPVAREGLRDILVNEQFRSDVFVRGLRAHTERGKVGAWFETRLALSRRYSGAPVKLSSRLSGTEVPAEHCAPVLDALAQGPATVRSLLEAGVFGTREWGAITRMLLLLAGAGFITPCLPAQGQETRAERCRRFNLAVCKRAEDSAALGFLASPVTGNGVALDRFEQLFLLARSEGHETPEDWAALAWRILAPQGQRLEQDGRVLETAEENLAVLRARAMAFAATRLPVCEMLGLTLEAPRAGASRTKAARDAA